MIYPKKNYAIIEILIDVTLLNSSLASWKMKIVYFPFGYSSIQKKI